MTQRRLHPGVLVAAGLLLAALHTADLLLWTDSYTGFAVAGPAWARFALWLAALGLPYLPARWSAAQPAALRDRNMPLGVAMMVTGLLLGGSGALALPTARFVARNPGLVQGYPPFAAVLDAALPLLAGLWLLVYGVRAMLGYGVQRQRLGGPLMAVVVPLCFLWRLVWRFQFVPAALYRLPCTLRVLSAVAALLFAVVLLKVFLVPGLSCGHTLFAAGAGCFLLCTGLELPQTIWEALNGMLVLPDLLAGLAFGALGVCGLLCAWAACGADAADTDP